MAAGELGVGLSVYSNNYKGSGHTIDASLGFGKSVGGGADGWPECECKPWMRKRE